MHILQKKYLNTGKILSQKENCQKLVSIRFIIIDMVKNMELKIAAYNARFDYRAGNTTQRFLTTPNIVSSFLMEWNSWIF